MVVTIRVAILGMVVDGIGRGGGAFGNSGLVFPLKRDGRRRRRRRVSGIEIVLGEGKVIEFVVEGGGARGTGRGTEEEVAESLRARRSSHVWRRASAVEIEIHGVVWNWNHHFHLHC